MRLFVSVCTSHDLTLSYLAFISLFLLFTVFVQFSFPFFYSHFGALGWGGVVFCAIMQHVSTMPATSAYVAGISEHSIYRSRACLWGVYLIKQSCAFMTHFIAKFILTFWCLTSFSVCWMSKVRQPQESSTPCRKQKLRQRAHSYTKWAGCSDVVTKTHTQWRGRRRMTGNKRREANRNRKWRLVKMSG